MRNVDAVQADFNGKKHIIDHSVIYTFVTFQLVNKQTFNVSKLFDHFYFIIAHFIARSGKC